MPRVAVIIPNYNHGEFLRQRITSVLSQTFEDIEVILLDDGSTDDSRAIIEEYRSHPKVTACIINSINSGSAFRQWERGLARASADYIWIAESDDAAAPPLLETLSGVLDLNHNVGLAYCQSLKIDEAGNVVGSWKAQTEPINGNPWTTSFVAPGREMLRIMLHLNVIPNASAVLFRRKLLTLEVLGEASNYTINGDWFIWCNLLAKSDLAFVNEDMNSCRFHPQKGSIQNIRNFNNILEFYRVRAYLFRELDLSAEAKEPLNASLFAIWMKQRESMGVSKDAPETSRVLQIAEAIDPKVRDRLQIASN